MSKTFHVLFVCMGNICRSPAAECVFRYRLSQQEGLEWVNCDSAGTLSEHAGQHPDHRMQEELRARGIPVVGTARQIRAEDLSQFDLILAMDQENLSYIRSLPGAEEAEDKIRLFTDFCQSAKADHVPDPYYGGKKGFKAVVDLLEDGIQGLLQSLSKK